MTQRLTFDLDLPGDLERFRLPEGVSSRLHELLDRQDAGTPLTDPEWREAEGLVSMAELLTYLRLKTVA